MYIQCIESIKAQPETKSGVCTCGNEILCSSMEKQNQPTCQPFDFVSLSRYHSNYTRTDPLDVASRVKYSMCRNTSETEQQKVQFPVTSGYNQGQRPTLVVCRPLFTVVSLHLLPAFIQTEVSGNCNQRRHSVIPSYCIFANSRMKTLLGPNSSESELA